MSSAYIVLRIAVNGYAGLGEDRFRRAVRARVEEDRAGTRVAEREVDDLCDAGARRRLGECAVQRQPPLGRVVDRDHEDAVARPQRRLEARRVGVVRRDRVFMD
jgi:hypothetical protein